jgi:hypothetical protein
MGTQDTPGKCPVDGRALVQMTMALTWTCHDGKKESLERATCQDGSPMTAVYSTRPHGNHNPQHGGQFFMAPDNWHHLEGAYFAPGTFRLYLYDDFTKPLPSAQVRDTRAHLILTKDGKEFPLARNGRFLEAKVGKLPLPSAMEVRVKFQPLAQEHLFDFTFEKFSKDAVSAAPTSTNAAPMSPAGSSGSPAVPSGAPGSSAPGSRAAVPPGFAQGSPAAVSPAAQGSPGAPSPGLSESGVDPALVTAPIPETVPELLAELHTRNDQIKDLIDRGQFTSVYVPAFQAKDVALALDAHRGELPEDRQRIVEPAVNRLVRDAYLLDAFGDLGNRQQIAEAYARFAVAVKDIESAFPRASIQQQ